MELMAGGSLMNQVRLDSSSIMSYPYLQLNDYGALSMSNTVLFTRQILSGLVSALCFPLSDGSSMYSFELKSYLHSKGAVHRDIKPANILRHTKALVKIGRTPSPRGHRVYCSGYILGDFGSAKYLQALCSEEGAELVGTPHYIPPEIVKGKKYDQRSDIWSLGVTVRP